MYTLQKLLSEFGGLASILFNIFILIPFPLSFNLVMGDLIEQIFFLKDSGKENYELKFSHFEKIQNLILFDYIRVFLGCICCK